LLFVPLLIAAIVVSGTYVVAQTFTARTTKLPPQSQQTAALAALASLGALFALGGLSSRTPADQYVSLLQSTTIADRVIDKFQLTEVYETKFGSDSRQPAGHGVSRLGLPPPQCVPILSRLFGRLRSTVGTDGAGRSRGHR
jgi:capsule polysaccharide export protein KpsE/RkpR